MSSEQPEVQTLPSEQPEVQTLPDAVDITQQATSLAPKTHVKNPKRVAAGKMVAARTKKNKEEQKKKNAEAEAALANKNEKSAVPEQKEEESGLTVNEWIGIGGLVVSVLGLLKREEIMATVRKNLPSPPSPPEPTPAPPEETAPKRKVLRKMD